METITSRRHFRKFYLMLILITVIFFLFGFVTLGLFIHLYYSNQFETRNYGLVGMFLLLVLGWLYIIYRHIKFAPSIRVCKDWITFNNSSPFYWRDLEKIELTGKRPFLFFADREGVLLKFKGQKERVFLDCMYTNTGQIKRFIQCVVIDKASVADVKITHPDINETVHEKFVVYKGIQLLNFRGVLLCLIIGALLYASILSRWRWGPLVFLSLLGAVSMVAISWSFYYFEVSDNYLLVRNHNLFWIKKLYRLTDIKEIVFEQQDKMPVCLRLITNDFESKLYPAATLRSKRWLQLKEDLEKKNIKVRNECVTYEPFEFKLFQ